MMESDTEIMSPQDILTRLQELEQVVTAEVCELDNEEVNFNSDVKEWSVKQIIAHLRDAEQIYHERMQKILAEDEPFLRAFNPEELAEERNYQEENWEEVLKGFQANRARNLQLFQSLAPLQWQKAGIHQERGRITIHEIGESLVRHNEQHLEQIRHVSWLAK